MIQPILEAWERARSQLERVPRRWALAPTIGIGMAIALNTGLMWDAIWYERGGDYGFFIAQAERFLDGAGFYEPHQLAGPFVFTIGVDNVYPPPALLLFLAFALLPGPLWWAIPLAAIGGAVLAWRPSPWAWPVIAVLCWMPRTQAIVIWGNTTLWITAFVALGLWFAWPSVLVLIKPYFAPLALIGIRHRAWWVAAAVFVAINLVLLPVWADYLTAWRNAGSSWPSLSYSPADVFILSIPIVAWLARAPAAPLDAQRDMTPTVMHSN
ncbi:MAG: hypothetical protein L0227_18145 [Chloroflexi bacterium]|nr:hypothetical protein [Chloroflexota bacterium]